MNSLDNYPNMSYCMCRNTLQAIEQLLDYMQGEGPYFLREMSRSERRAYDELYHRCQSFVRNAEELAEDEERYNAFIRSDNERFE